jgi:hypothetical protein
VGVNLFCAPVSLVRFQDAVSLERPWARKIGENDPPHVIKGKKTKKIQGGEKKNSFFPFQVSIS